MQLYNAVVTKFLQTPESLIKLTICGCKTGCNTTRRKYQKNGGLKCTEMRKCENCENVELEDLLNPHDHDLKKNKEHEQ